MRRGREKEEREGGERGRGREGREEERGGEIMKKPLGTRQGAFS